MRELSKEEAADPRRWYAGGMLQMIEEDPSRFEPMLRTFYVAGSDLPLAQRPPLLRRTRVLVMFLSTVSVHDSGRFLHDWPDEEALYTEEAIGWCEEMGVPKVAEMIRRLV